MVSIWLKMGGLQGVLHGSVCSGELKRPLITYGVLSGTVIQCSKVE